MKCKSGLPRSSQSTNLLRFLEWSASQLPTSGGMGEWLMPAVLKTADPSPGPWVRIPLPPPFSKPLASYISRQQQSHMRG